jgi:uncharacterized LabA/DUF88 family protein
VAVLVQFSDREGKETQMAFPKDGGNGMSTRTPGIEAILTERVDEKLGQLERTLKQMRSNERVCLFIDNSNLFHALKNMDLGNKRLDYIKLRDYLADGRSASVRFYYSTPTNGSIVAMEDRRRQEKRNKFYDFLESNLGYTMIELPLRERTIMVEGQPTQVPVEKGLDCEIVYDMAILSRTGRYNTFILVAGDEDYARTIRRIRQETGMSVEVAFFGSAGCSSVLTREASRFIDLNCVKEDLFRDHRGNEFTSTY